MTVMVIYQSENLNNFGKECSKYFAEGIFQVAVKEYFWPTPYEYYSNWYFTEQFRKCLRGFVPFNLCTLRTVKGDLICGLEPGMSEQLTMRKSDWMFTGEFGVVQYAEQC